MKFVELVNKVVKLLCIVFFLVLLVSMILMIVSRNVSFINFDVVWVDEVGRYIFVYMVFLGSGLAMLERKHMRVTFFLEMLPLRARKILETCTNLLMMGFCLVMINGGLTLVNGSKSQIVLTLRKYFRMPMAVWNSAVVVSGGLMMFYIALNMYLDYAGKDEADEAETMEVTL